MARTDRLNDKESRWPERRHAQAAVRRAAQGLAGARGKFRSRGCGDRCRRHHVQRCLRQGVLRAGSTRVDQVVRVWHLPVETLLAGGLGMLPLAPISAVAQADLPRVIERIKKRLRRRSRAEAGSLWTATYVLMGLRYEQALINQLLQGVIAMEESVTYQAIVAKGERQGALREARRTILLLGRERFGAAGTSVTSAIEAIDDLERLEQLSIRLLQAESWKELLPAPQPTSRQAKQVPRKNDRRGKKPT